MKEQTRLQLVLVGSCVLSTFVGFIGGGLIGRATAPSCDVCPPQRSVLMHTVGENAATATGELEVVCNVEILSTVRDSELAVCDYDAAKSTRTRYTDGMTTVSTDCAVAECIEDKFVEESRRRRRLAADGSRCQEKTMKFKCPNVKYKGTSENYGSGGFNKQVSCSHSLTHLKRGGRGWIEYFTQTGFQGKKTASPGDLPQRGQKGFVHCEYQDLQGALHDLPIVYWEDSKFSFFAGVSTEGYSVVYRQLFGTDNVTTIGSEPVSWDSKGRAGTAKPDWITIMPGVEASNAPPEDMQDLKFYVDRSAYTQPDLNDVMVEFMMTGTDGKPSQKRLACCPPIKDAGVSFDVFWEGMVPKTFEEAFERMAQAHGDVNHPISKTFAKMQTALLY
jgi:hypothetical protein